MRAGPMTPMTPMTPRAVCDRCRRPRRVCYCAALPQLATRTRVVILQHPRERDMPIGTARMASLCLPQAALHVGVRWSESAPLAAALADPARPPILLYPGPGARDILRAPPAGPVTLVVVDGTWSQAKNVVRDNPVLQTLPRYAFSAPEPSQYRIRREPSAACVSTIEALMHVLGVLEGEPAPFRALLDPLRAMVDAQILCRTETPQRRHRHARPPRPPGLELPAAVSARFADLVCVTAEANAWPYAAGDSPTGEDEAGELVHWVAARPSTGEQFDVIAAPERALSPTTLLHTALDEPSLRGGVPRSELLARFAAFLRPSDIVCSWGHYGTNLFLQSGGTLPAASLDLRAAAKRHRHGKIGSLESYAASLGPAPPPTGPGRAGHRLALLLQIVTAWRALAATDAAARG